MGEAQESNILRRLGSCRPDHIYYSMPIANQNGQRPPVYVTIAAPCRNERDAIDGFLDRACGQADVPGGFEIIIADGASSDGTRARIEARAAADARVRLIDNPLRQQAAGLNQAIREARGTVIVRMDVHTTYAPDYLRECVAALAGSPAANVGGPARTTATGYFQRANAAAYQSRFSVGGARFHDPDYEGWVDTVPYGCWRRDYLLEIGLYDESFARNEDDELNLRITERGDRIWQTPRIRSWYQPRRTPSALFAQYHQYGYWKVPVILKHRKAASWRHLVPALAVCLCALVAVAAAVSTTGARLALVLAGLYLGLGLVASGRACARCRDWVLLPILPMVFAIYHTAYGLGFIRGLMDFVALRRPAAGAMSRVTR